MARKKELMELENPTMEENTLLDGTGIKDGAIPGEGHGTLPEAAGVGRHFKWSGDCTVAANKNLPIKAVTHTACGKKGHAFFLA